MAEEEMKRDPTEEEVNVAFSGDAPACNRFVVTLGATGLRIAFIEDAPNGKAWFRGAVSMHPLDGIKLATLLDAMLADLKVQFETAVKVEKV